MEANSWHHKLLPFWIWKFGKEGKKLQEFEYLENEKSFLDEIKNIFHSFLQSVCTGKSRIPSSFAFGYRTMVDQVLPNL